MRRPALCSCNELTRSLRTVSIGLPSSHNQRRHHSRCDTNRTVPPMHTTTAPAGRLSISRLRRFSYSSGVTPEVSSPSRTRCACVFASGWPMTGGFGFLIPVYVGPEYERDGGAATAGAATARPAAALGRSAGRISWGRRADRMMEEDVVKRCSRWTDFSNFCPRSVGSMARHGCHHLEPMRPPSSSRFATTSALRTTAKRRYRQLSVQHCYCTLACFNEQRN